LKVPLYAHNLKDMAPMLGSLGSATTLVMAAAAIALILTSL
jgi:hypothetical protein